MTNRSISRSTAVWPSRRRPISVVIWRRVENNARDLGDRQAVRENELLSVSAASWPEAAAKASYVLNLNATGLSPDDTRHRDLVAAIFEGFERLANNERHARGMFMLTSLGTKLQRLRE